MPQQARRSPFSSFSRDPWSGRSFSFADHKARAEKFRRPPLPSFLCSAEEIQPFSSFPTSFDAKTLDTTAAGRKILPPFIIRQNGHSLPLLRSFSFPGQGSRKLCSNSLLFFPRTAAGHSFFFVARQLDFSPIRRVDLSFFSPFFRCARKNEGTMFKRLFPDAADFSSDPACSREGR